MSQFMGTSVTRGGNLTVVIDCVPHTVGQDHENYAALKDAIKKGDADLFLERLQPQRKIVEYVKKEVEEAYDNSGLVYNEIVGEFYYCGHPLHNVVTNRIDHLRKEGMPFQPMLVFLENLMQNPSMASVQELYDFLEHGNMPITDDGCFIGYKAVEKYEGEEFVDVNGKLVKAGDLVDKYSRQVRNNVGDSPEMPRNLVDDNRSQTCSHGYHVGALTYSGPEGWYTDEGDTVLLVKVNPKDAVSVPTDHSRGKLRTCKYEVIGIYKQPLQHSLYAATGEELDEYDDWEDDDEDFDFEDYVSIDDVELDDEIKFWYTNKGNGERKYRHIFVTEKHKDRILGELAFEDPNFMKHDVGQFIVKNMEEIVFV